MTANSRTQVMCSMVMKLVLLVTCLALCTNAKILEHIGYKYWLRGGDVYTADMKPLNSNGFAFGQIVDANGKGVYTLDLNASYQVAPDPDFTSIIKARSGRIFSISSFEYSFPSSHYITELNQDKETGILTAVSTRPVDWSKWNGIIAPCAGSQSPWNTHIHGEEVDPDARNFEDAKTWSDFAGDISGDATPRYARFWGYYNITKTKTLANGIEAKPLDFQAFKKLFNPYNYGHTLQITVGDNGEAYPEKLLVVGGRIGFEATICMPNGKVCYSNDDNYQGVFTMTIFNKAFNPYSGTLYAAKLTTLSGADGGTFKVDWIKLGKSSQRELKAILDSGIKFSDIFAAAEFNATSKGCDAAGFKAVSTVVGFECLKLKKGKQIAAAFFETRRYAAYVGATTENSRAEGIAFDPLTRSLFFTNTIIDQGIVKNSSYDLPGVDHMQVDKPNTCGCVFQALLSPTYITHTIKSLICGKELPTPVDGNRCDLEGLASPDNVAVVRGTSTLVIYEDTSRHINNMLWAYDLNKGPSSLTRIQTDPYGSEHTAGNYVSNLNGWDYLIAVVQHPYENAAGARLLDSESTGRAAWVGYLGPFPTKAIKGNTLEFSKVPVAVGPAQHRVVSSSYVTVY